MASNDEKLKYIRLLIRLRKAAAELEEMSDFELAMRADDFGIDESELCHFMHNNDLFINRGSDKHE